MIMRWEKERQEGSSGGVPTGVIESLRFTIMMVMLMMMIMMVKMNDNHDDFNDDEEADEGAAEASDDDVVHCRKVATSDSGLLTFERFCAGLKICLLRNQKVCKPLKKPYTSKQGLCGKIFT